MKQSQKLPKGFELIEHHNPPDFFNEEKGIIVSIIERNDKYLDPGLNSWYYKVSVAENQKTIYEGSFQSLSHAYDKCYELMEKYA